MFSDLRAEIQKPHSKSYKQALLFLLLLDAVFVVLYVGFQVYSHFSGERIPVFWSIDTQLGFASIYNYGKYILAVFALCVLYRNFGSKMSLYFAALFFILFLDDAMELHDQFGLIIGQSLDQAWLGDIHRQDRGEIVVYAGLLVIAIWLCVSAFRSACPKEKSSAILLILLVGLLAFFGGAVDVAHGVIKSLLTSHIYLFNTLMTAIEDGGEMIVMSFIASYCLFLWGRASDLDSWG